MTNAGFMDKLCLIEFCHQLRVARKAYAEGLSEHAEVGPTLFHRLVDLESACRPQEQLT